MSRDPEIIFHADDFGANKEISSHIIRCIREGALNSMSILANSPHLGECMELLQREVRFSIHFNIAEGRPLSDWEGEDPLVDERGCFGPSFFKVLFISLSGGGRRKLLKERLKKEFSAQLDAALPYIEEIRIDSHQHYHMIPVVLESIMEVCEAAQRQTGKRITFIRIPAEPFTPYLQNPGIIPTIKPINIIKNLVLRFCGVLDSGILAPYRDRTAVFFGVTLSGGMDIKRVKRLLPAFRSIAAGRGLPLEVLGHPGGVRGVDELMDPGNADCAAFYTSDGRRMEEEMFLGIGRY